ncbi:hypothetical protein AB1L05_14355 [Cytobacillus horneckiae]
MPTNQEAWANTLGYDHLDPEQYLLLFELLRSSMLPILNKLTAEQANRVGVYQDAGHFTFKQLLAYRVQHIRGHLIQIENVKAGFRQRGEK